MALIPKTDLKPAVVREKKARHEEDGCQYAKIDATVAWCHEEGRKGGTRRGIRKPRSPNLDRSLLIHSAALLRRWAKKCSLACENFLPSPAWLLPSKSGPLFSPFLYNIFTSYVQPFDLCIEEYIMFYILLWLNVGVSLIRARGCVNMKCTADGKAMRTT